MEEENGYFKNVVKDALKELKENGRAYVFFIEQVNAVKEKFKGELKIEERDEVFYLTKI